jgi:hypothetical protein
VIIYKRFNMYHESSVIHKLTDTSQLWLMAHVGSVLDHTTVTRPGSIYAELIWTPIYEWQEKFAEFKTITSDPTLKDKINIIYGDGWRIASSITLEPSFKKGSMAGDTEFWFVIDNDTLAVQFKLAVM